MAPSWGTSCLRSIKRILSTVSMSGLKPPWTQRTAPVVVGGGCHKEGGCWEVVGVLERGDRGGGLERAPLAGCVDCVDNVGLKSGGDS